MALTLPTAAQAAVQTPANTFSPTSTPLANTTNSLAYTYDTVLGVWNSGGVSSALPIATSAQAAAGTSNSVLLTPATGVPKDAANMTGAALIPGGNNAARPAPVTGMVRYNSQAGVPVSMEYYNGAAWAGIGGTEPWSGYYSGAQSAAGASSVQWTGIPTWVERITVLGDTLSTNGTSIPEIQVGSGFFATAGYTGTTWGQSSGQLAFSLIAWATGIPITNNMVSTMVYDPYIMITKVTGNNWVVSGGYGRRGDGLSFHGAGGYISLPGPLDRVRFVVGGGNVFDSGTFNVLYEGPA